MKEVAVLAVDVGGTWCRALFCSNNGQILDYTQGGSGNYHSIGAKVALSNLSEVLTSLTKQQAHRVQCAVFGLAGLDTEKDRVFLQSIVQQALVAANIVADHVYVDNDAMVTLKGIARQNNGVMIVAGTGSIAWGITQDGREARVGGWGYRIGDEGSGYSIGKAAVTHILRAYDGREATSGICAAVLEEMSFADEDALVNWVYSPEFSIKKMAAFAPLIMKLAESGDWKAIEISVFASQQLADMVFAVVRKLDIGNEKMNLIFCGGVLQSPIIKRQLIALLADFSSDIQVTIPDYQPICAGANYGLMLMGLDYDISLQQLSKQLSAITFRS